MPQVDLLEKDATHYATANLTYSVKLNTGIADALVAWEEGRP